MPVSPIESNCYANWRLQCGKAFFLGEASLPVPEKLLQAIWHHQRLLRDQLKTLDGKTVRVLHPGFWNHEAGPDFRDAVVQIGDEPPKSGDVEIDVRVDGWKHHRHDTNPNFANVLLHVIWEAETSDSCRVTTGNPVAQLSLPTATIPTMALKTFLDAPLNELALWLGSDSAENLPPSSIGQCCAPLRDLPEKKLDELLRQAAFVRFQRKANDLQARARQSGWEQALWEGIFRALGYKQNVWPMQRLGELIPNAEGGARPAENSQSSVRRSAFHWQAWLFGISGLLPVQPDKGKADPYLRSIWDIWWRERDQSHDLIFPKNVWRFSGMRPANSPQRRLALASHWLADEMFFPRLEKWFTDPINEFARGHLLVELLRVECDDFWSWHWGFNSVQLPQPQPLIGTARVFDLAINVILPWFWIRAVTGKNEVLQKRAEKIYFAWPAAEDNSALRRARQRLFGKTIAPRELRTAAAQQGLLQIVRDFCEHSNAICEDCRFPDLVRGLNLQSA